MVLLFVAAAWAVVLRTGLFWQGTAVARTTGVFLTMVAPVVLAWQGWYLFRRRNLSRWHLPLAVLSWLYLVGIAALIVWVMTRLPTPR